MAGGSAFFPPVSQGPGPGTVGGVAGAGPTQSRVLQTWPDGSPRWVLLRFLSDLKVGEFDGRPGEEILMIYRAPNDPTRRAYDILAWQ